MTVVMAARVVQLISVASCQMERSGGIKKQFAMNKKVSGNYSHCTLNQRLYDLNISVTA